MNEKQLNRVLNRLAEELVPASVDLWPDIRKRFESSKRHSIKGDFSMATQVDHHKRFVKPLRLAGLCILALLILSGLVAVTPLGRAWAQEILHFFTRAGSDTLPIHDPTSNSWDTHARPSQHPRRPPEHLRAGLHGQPG